VWKEKVLISTEALFLYLPENTEELHKISQIEQAVPLRRVKPSIALICSSSATGSTRAFSD
jgi:hypothetical protein